MLWLFKFFPEKFFRNVSNFILSHFYFSSKVKHKEIALVRSFSHTLEELNDISYLNDEMVEEIDQITVKQLQDSVVVVFNKTSNISISEMFSTKHKFASDLFKMVVL